MAYAAVTSLFHTIHLLLTSCRTCPHKKNKTSRIFLASSTQKLLKSGRRSANRLRNSLEEYNYNKNNSPGVMAVEARIRDEARKLEDAIESEASAKFLEIRKHDHDRVYLNLNSLRHDIECFVEAAKKLKAEYMKELHKREEVAADFETGWRDCNIETVGFSCLVRETRDYIAELDSSEVHVTSVTGMAGVGKTKLVKRVFEDLLGEELFERGAFVRVGQKYVYEEILQDILAQLNVDGEDGMCTEGQDDDDDDDDDEGLEEYFERSLKGRKILIVFDDVWDIELGDLCNYFPLGSCVFVTSRLQRPWVACITNHFTMPMMNAEESWELLQKKVFGEDEECPPQLVKAGKKIAENCEGLPLLIISVAEILSKAPRNGEYWKEVAEMKNSFFEEAMDQIYNVLLPSYHFLEQRSKACFLYLGAFPKKCIIRRSRIINLWRAERFGDAVAFILEDLVSSNLIIVHQGLWSHTAKDFNLHLVYRHLTKREGENNKFLHILKSYDADDDAGSTIEQMKDMRYLAVHHNTLLAIKEVHSSIASVSALRSVLCSGPYHQYQVPIAACLELKLLRVLDVVSIRFYEFPVEVVQLMQLRYLSLTSNANLPPAINKLWFLEFLIVRQHSSIINRTSTRIAESSSYVPVEIWDLPELKHLQITGRNLPHPPPGAVLPNLTKLLDVGVQTCSKGVLESLPKLEKLRIQIESAPDNEADVQTMSCTNNLSCLEKLQSFRCVVRNPKLFQKPSVPLRCLSASMNSLLKLCLSGFGYPWEDMSKIAGLPNLEMLKLKSYAFRGEKWEAKEMKFKFLQHLLIEDTDLVQWTAAVETFPRLSYLTMKNCHKLQEMPALNTYASIQLFDCNPLAETCANQTVHFTVDATYSWML